MTSPIHEPWSDDRAALRLLYESGRDIERLIIAALITPESRGAVKIFTDALTLSQAVLGLDREVSS